MKRTLLCAALALLILAAACQPTPDHDAVKQKNTNQLIELVIDAEIERKNEEQESTYRGEPVPTPVPVRETVPERFQYDFTTDTGTHVAGEGAIRVLTDGAFPMIRVERRTLTNEERLLLAGRLLGTDELYVYRDVLSSRSVEDFIRTYIGEYTLEDFIRDTGNADGYEELIEFRKEQLAYWQQYYLEMPDDDSPTPFVRWDGSPDGERGVGVQVVTESEGRTNIGMLPAAGFLPDDRGRMIDYDNPQSDPKKSAHWFGFNDTSKRTGAFWIAPEEYDTVHEGATVTPRDAVNAVLPYFDGLVSLGIEDIWWSNNADSDGDNADVIGTWGYLARLTPVYNGATLCYSNATISMLTQSGEYAPKWNYESVVAAVSPDGVLLSLCWQGAMQVEKTIAEYTKLLDYSEIERLFMRQMNRAVKIGEKSEVRVTGVKLGLFRIREQNSMETGLLVPAWVYNGTVTWSNGESFTRDSTDPLCVINAIDGSIIDPMKGY